MNALQRNTGGNGRAPKSEKRVVRALSGFLQDFIPATTTTELSKTLISRFTVWWKVKFRRRP